jgi:uncharacterized membrane protein
MFKQEPLSSTYMLLSMMGFIISALMLEILPSWAFAFMVVFIVMFVASIVSMSNIPFDDKVILEKLKIHNSYPHVKKRKRKIINKH